MTDQSQQPLAGGAGKLTELAHEMESAGYGAWARRVLCALPSLDVDEDDIAEAIDDTLGPGWSSRDAARAIVDLLQTRSGDGSNLRKAARSALACLSGLPDLEHVEYTVSLLRAALAQSEG